VRLGLCDDNRILCEALSVALEARGHQVLAAATTTTLGIAEVAAHQPDACLLDLRFADPPDDLSAAWMIRKPYPGTAGLLLSGLADRAVIAEATRIGVAGFLRKDQNVNHIARALDVVSSGRVVFGPVQPHQAWSPGMRRCAARDLISISREREVLRRIIARQSTKQMSREMNVASSTLRSYVKNMFAKLGAHSRLEARFGNDADYPRRMKVFLHLYTGQNRAEPTLCSTRSQMAKRLVRRRDPPTPVCCIAG